MSNRRYWLATAIAACTGLLARPLLGQQRGGANPTQQGRGAATLQDQLVKGLRATTAEQKQYAETVAAAVDAGRLPRGMVNQVYRWALERNPKVPFPYFQYALNIVSRRRGITL